MKKKGSSAGKLRPPIVSVVGHVDHGKTTLLDAIRKTDVASREVGGITQSIGASVVETKNKKKITFIDTPGHAAFSKMRSRGAKVADIAVLVVAADDGVKPQTREALKYIREADIPFIVAATKMDLSSASALKVRKGLEDEKVSFEKKGGDVVLIEVSAKKGKGLNELLEMINLVAEVSGVTGDPDGKLEAVVIETDKDKGGPLASVVVRNGTLKVADTIFADGLSCKVKSLFGTEGEKIDKALPGEPAQILGFAQLLPVGSLVSDEPRERAAEGKEEESERKPEGFPVIVKAKTTGSLEAVLSNLGESVSVVGSGVGEVSLSEVFLAKSAGATVIAYGVSVSKNVAKLAQSEGVKIESFELIYEIFERLEELANQEPEDFLGRAEILASFPYNNKKVAGCIVLAGRISKNDKLILKREGEELGFARVASLKKQKDEVNTVKEGEEFGVILAPQLDFEIGDVLVSVKKKARDN